MRVLLLVCLTMVALRVHGASPVEDDEDKIQYSNWNYAAPANGSQFPYIAYEIKRTGFHSVELHFKNFAPHDISFDYWLPGYQPSARPFSVRVPVSAPNDRQWIVPVDLACGATGAVFSQLKMTRIKIEGSASYVSTGNSAGETPEPVRMPGDEAWLSIVPDQLIPAFMPESVAYRIVHETKVDHVLFRNTSRQNVYFNFVVNGYQSPDPKQNARVSLAMGQEQSVAVVLNHPDAMVSLARVKALDIRIHADSGPYLDEKELEDGWFAVSALNCPTFNPNQITYRFDTSGSESSDLTLHFRNNSRLPVDFEYSVVNQSPKGRVAMDANGETSVSIPRFKNSMPLSLTRIRVTDVRYGALPTPKK